MLAEAIVEAVIDLSQGLPAVDLVQQFGLLLRDLQEGGNQVLANLVGHLRDHADRRSNRGRLLDDHDLLHHVRHFVRHVRASVHEGRARIALPIVHGQHDCVMTTGIDNLAQVRVGVDALGAQRQRGMIQPLVLSGSGRHIVLPARSAMPRYRCPPGQ